MELECYSEERDKLVEQKRQRNSTESVSKEEKSTLKAKMTRPMGLEKHNGASEKLGQGRWGPEC